MLKIVILVVVSLITLGILSIAVCLNTQDFYDIEERESEEK